MIDDPSFDITKALSDHYKLLEIKRFRIDQLINTIDKTISNIKGDKNMKDKELFGGFTKKEMKEFDKEAEERWGETDAYKQSKERTKKWTKNDFTDVFKQWNAIAQGYARNMDKGFGSKEVQAVVQKHWDQINKFYDCNCEIFKGLAEMYVADERFAANYRKYHQDLPEFIREAMLYYCDHQ